MQTITITKERGEVTGLTQPIGLSLDLLRNGRYTLTIKREREGSNTAQTRLLWMWLGCIQAQTGDNKNDLYKFFCKQFLWRKVDVFGVTDTVYDTTGDLDKQRMTWFLDKVRRYVMENVGIRLPLPEDRMFEEFQKRYG